MTKTLVPALCVLVLGGCADLCNELSAGTAPAAVYRVEENIEYEARKAGIHDGDLRSVAEEMLRARGATMASSDSEANVIVKVDLRILDPGHDGYAGMVQLAMKEPARLRLSNRSVYVTTVSNSLVFITPKSELRDYVRGNLRDAVESLLKSHQP
jgi:hypothetical protein